MLQPPWWARIPKSSAIRTAAFSPIAIAVLYVFAPTFPGIMLQSKGAHYSVKLPRGASIRRTCHFQALRSIHVQPRVHYASIASGFHGTCAHLRTWIIKKEDTSIIHRVKSRCCNCSMELINCFVIVLGISNVWGINGYRAFRLFGFRNASCWELGMSRRVFASIKLHSSYNFPALLISPSHYGDIHRSFDDTQALELLM